jgi:hypothetical protein
MLMAIAFFLMFTSGMVGAFDQVYYHIYKFKLHKRQITRWEHLTHVGRDLTYLLFFILMNVRATGKWWSLFPLVAAIHFVNAMADVALEPYTRRTLGGIPGGEYRLHGFILIMDGLAMGFVFWGAQAYRHVIDEFAWSPLRLPSVLGMVPYLAMILAIGFFTHDFVYLCRTFYLRAVRRAREVGEGSVLT